MSMTKSTDNHHSTENPYSSIANTLWRQGVYTAALFVAMIALGVAAYLIRNSDVEQRVRETASFIDRQEKQIAFLCETTTTLDILVVQEATFLRLLLKNPESGIGPNERRLLREREATLQTAHFELSDQQPCKDVQ
jgi:hypothetical protein